MGVPLLPIWLLLTGLLGLIGESTCVSTYEETFRLVKINTSHFLSKRKGMCEGGLYHQIKNAYIDVRFVF